MKLFCSLWFTVLVSIAGAAAAQQPRTTSPVEPVASSAAHTSTSTQQPTSAQQRVMAAKQQIKAPAKEAQPYDELALALIRRARETANPTYYKDAEQAISAGLALAPNDFQLEKAHVALLLGKHEFAPAQKEAARLNRRTPDDVTTYGYLAEADIALGDYPDAEKAAQWMLNLRPNNVPGLLIGAELRNLYGDPEGALELLNQAYSETPSTENEELAWIANQIARIEIGSGKLDAASRVLARAEQLVPAYPDTLENLARLELEQHNYPGAIASLRREENTSPDVRLLYQLATTQELAAQAGEAATTYANFEAAAKPLVNEPANANRDLIFYYADHARNASQALSVAQHEIGLRHDVWTLDAYAWALYGNARYAEADAQMQKALAVGARSAQLFDHAGNIALKLGKQAEAGGYFESSLQVDPSSEYASDDRKALGTFAAVPAISPHASGGPDSASDTSHAAKDDDRKPPLHLLPTPHLQTRSPLQWQRMFLSPAFNRCLRRCLRLDLPGRSGPSGRCRPE